MRAGPGCATTTRLTHAAPLWLRAGEWVAASEAVDGSISMTHGMFAGVGAAKRQRCGPLRQRRPGRRQPCVNGLRRQHPLRGGYQGTGERTHAHASARWISTIASDAASVGMTGDAPTITRLSVVPIRIATT
jgi:hypothetical protein